MQSDQKPFICLIYIDNRKQPIIYNVFVIFHILATTWSAVHGVEMANQIIDWKSYGRANDNSNRRMDELICLNPFASI